jgi:hypothetical protein
MKPEPVWIRMVRFSHLFTHFTRKHEPARVRVPETWRSGVRNSSDCMQSGVPYTLNFNYSYSVASAQTAEICMRELSRALRESGGVAYVFLEVPSPPSFLFLGSSPSLFFFLLFFVFFFFFFFFLFSFSLSISA